MLLPEVHAMQAALNDQIWSRSPQHLLLPFKGFRCHGRTEALVLEVGALVVEAGVVEALVVEALVLEVAVEAIVVEGLGVVTAVATVGSSTKESTKEPASQMLNFCFD